MPHLSALLDDPEPLIRGHAAWALRQIDTVEAQRRLQAAISDEQDERVRIEIAGQT